MENIKDYIVVQSRDKYNISPIPKHGLLTRLNLLLERYVNGTGLQNCPLRSLNAMLKFSKIGTLDLVLH